MDISKIVTLQHRFFDSGVTKNVDFRIQKLKELRELLKQHEEDFFVALRKDFKKPAFETYGTELQVLYEELNHTIKNLHSWTKPEKVRGSLANFPSRNYIFSEPYGVALIIGAWNYPILLALHPAINALSAGNCIVIKPSEISRHTSSLLADLLNERFNAEFLRVVEGDAGTAKELLTQPLDYIFFTGSTSIGKKVMKAAAEQLTPVTLELGGKSPTIVDETANLEVAAKRIVWGKLINAGQTCVAPDYLYVQETIKAHFLKLLDRYITEFYGTDPKRNPDYPGIISNRHFERLKNLIDSSHIFRGGDTSADERYIEPTIMDNVTWDMPVMQEEIFGPVLPVLTFSHLDEAISEINRHPKPLAVYLFSNRTEAQEKVIEEIECGGGCINDAVVHFGNRNFPIGGVGSSGMGNYHGKAGFDTFSHKKSFLKKPTWIDLPFRYAPYNGKLKWIKKILK